MLRAVRMEHNVPLDQIRIALNFIQEELGLAHPLIRKDLLKTDGRSIYVEYLERLLDASRGQIAIRETLDIYLTRIEAGIAARLFPFIHPDEKDDQRLIVIDPAISFGHPVIAGTGIPTKVPTKVLAELHQAGDSLDDLALDYDCDRTLIQVAVEYETKAA